MSHVSAPSAATFDAFLPFDCTWQAGGVDAAWVRIAGDVDLATAPRLQATLAEALGGAHVVVVDLREVTFMDSTGLHVLMETQSHATRTGNRLVFVRGRRSVHRLFEVTGIDEQLQVVDLKASEPPLQALVAPAIRPAVHLIGDQR